MWHVYRSTDFLLQQLSLQRLNADVRSNNNALKEFNDCIGGLLHLGPNVITSRTVVTFRPSTMCTSSPFCSPIEPITMNPPNSHRSSWCLAVYPCYSSRRKSGQDGTERGRKRRQTGAGVVRSFYHQQGVTKGSLQSPKRRLYWAENTIWQLKTKVLLSFGTVTPKNEHLGRDAFEIWCWQRGQKHFDKTNQVC